nr:polyprotein [Ipomoea batatas]
MSRSSTEAEYRALAHAAAELVWIQNLLQEAGIRLRRPPSLLCDNLGATYMCKNPVFHSRMKHLALDYFFVHDMVAEGSLSVQHISACDQVADVLTKPLGRGLLYSRSSGPRLV